MHRNHELSENPYKTNPNYSWLPPIFPSYFPINKSSQNPHIAQVPTVFWPNILQNIDKQIHLRISLPLRVNEPRLPFFFSPTNLRRFSFSSRTDASFIVKAQSFIHNINYSFSWTINFYLFFEVQANIAFENNLEGSWKKKRAREVYTQNIYQTRGEFGLSRKKMRCESRKPQKIV